jgi:tetratricopeptide (TPR) repeat protein
MKKIELFEKLNNEAESYYTKFENSMAHELFLKCEQIALKIGDVELIADAKKNIGRTFHRLGEYEKAMEFYTEAIEILEKYDITTDLPTYLNHLAGNFMKQYNFEGCYSTSQKALKIAEQNKDSYTTGKIKNTLGVYYEYLGDLDKGLQFYQEALEIFDVLNEEFAISRTYNLISSIQRKIGNLELSKESLEKSRIYSQKYEDINNLGHSLINEVDILFEKGDFKGIRKILDRIQKLDDKIENFELRSIIKRKLGRVYQSEGNFIQSKQNIEEALEIAIKINYKDGIAKAYNHLGLIHLEFEEFLSSFQYFSKSIESFKEISEAISDPDLRKFYMQTFKDLPEILKKIEQIIDNKSYEIKDNELIDTLDNAKIVCQKIQKEGFDKNFSDENRDDTKRLFHKKDDLFERREKISLEWSEILIDDCFLKLKKDTRNHLILYKQVLEDSPWDYGSCIQKISNAIEAQLKDTVFARFQSLWESKFNKNYYYQSQDLEMQDRSFIKTFKNFMGFLRYNHFLTLEKIQNILILTIQIKDKNHISKPFIEFQNFLGPKNIIYIKEILKFLDYEFKCGKNKSFCFILIRGSISHGGKKQDKRRKIKIELNEEIIKKIENKLINEDLNLLHNLCSLKA